jgi:hypothetical protein
VLRIHEERHARRTGAEGELRSIAGRAAKLRLEDTAVNEKNWINFTLRCLLAVFGGCTPLKEGLADFKGLDGSTLKKCAGVLQKVHSVNRDQG